MLLNSNCPFFRLPTTFSSLLTIHFLLLATFYSLLTIHFIHNE
jgi:hypothetical protein